jgi:hypothetical protein
MHSSIHTILYRSRVVELLLFKFTKWSKQIKILQGFSQSRLLLTSWNNNEVSSLKISLNPPLLPIYSSCTAMCTNHLGGSVARCNFYCPSCLLTIFIRTTLIQWKVSRKLVVDQRNQYICCYWYHSIPCCVSVKITVTSRQFVCKVYRRKNNSSPSSWRYKLMTLVGWVDRPANIVSHGAYGLPLNSTAYSRLHSRAWKIGIT